MNILKKAKSVLNAGGTRSITLKKNILGSMMLRLISIVVSFALVPMTIGYVSSELYGVWLTLSSILTWLGFLDVGFTQGLKNKLAEAIAHDHWDKAKSLVSTTYMMMFVIFVPVCLVIEFIIPYVDWTRLLNVSSVYEDEIIRVMYVLIAFACLQLITNVLVSVVAAFQKVALSNSFLVIGNIISLGIIFILTKTCPPSLLSLAFSLAAMPIFVTIVASIILYSGQFKRVAPNIRCVKRKYISELFRLGYKFFIINIQVLVLYQSTNFLISNVSSPNDVTTYNIAYKLMSSTMMIFTIIAAPLWPAYTDAYSRNDFPWMRNTLKKMEKVLLLSIACCIILIISSPFIYSIWIKDRVEIPFIMSLMVGIYVIIYCSTYLYGTLLAGMSKIYLHTIVVLIGMFIHIPLSYFASSYLGAYGILTSMIIINSCYLYINHKQIYKLMNQKARGIWAK